MQKIYRQLFAFRQIIAVYLYSKCKANIKQTKCYRKTK